MAEEREWMQEECEAMKREGAGLLAEVRGLLARGRVLDWAFERLLRALNLDCEIKLVVRCGKVSIAELNETFWCDGRPVLRAGHGGKDE